MLTAVHTAAALRVVEKSHSPGFVQTMRPVPRLSLLVSATLSAIPIMLLAIHFGRFAVLALAGMTATAITVRLGLRWPASANLSRPHFVVLKGGLS